MADKPVAPIIQPDAIEAESFRIIDAEMGPHEFSVIEWPVVRRAIHSTADFELGRSLVFHPRAVEAGGAGVPEGAEGAPDRTGVQAGNHPTRTSESRGAPPLHIAPPRHIPSHCAHGPA